MGGKITAKTLYYASARQRKLSDDFLENEQQLGLVIISTLSRSHFKCSHRVTWECYLD